MASTATQVAPPDSPTLSASQLKTLAEVGEERTADAGDVLYRIGDASYPFIAILEGEVAIVHAERGDDASAAELAAGLDADSIPLVRLPGGAELRGPSTGQLSRALGIGRELAPVEEVDLLVVGAGPAGLGAAVYGASEGLDTLIIDSGGLGGQAGSSRRIENYLGFPAGITGNELTGRAVTQARKFNARLATPYRAVSLQPGNGRHVVLLEEGQEIAARAVLLATGAEYRRLPVDGLDQYEGIS